MTKFENYLIFAHYHSDGLIRKDLQNFFKKNKNIFREIVFISTNLKKSEKIKISQRIKIINRENIGYDFYSYKIGSEYFLKKFKGNLKNKKFFFINSSVLFVNSDKLIKIIKSIKIKENQMWGLTKSYELAEHVQSYFFCFSATVFQNKNISDWWSKIKTLTKRQDIINNYELGLSDLMIKNNIKLYSIYKKNLRLKSKNFIQKIKQRYREVVLKETKIYKKNPTNYFWEDIYSKFGIIKIELIKKNPNKIDIKKLKIIFKKNRNLKIDAFNN
jgi:rhamnosyltransferase|tara:strand:+ start:2112 stop:2930 length:819 start_codon:yes stop_codon:yes gene_type:complete